MICCLISDTHCDTINLEMPKADLLVHCGDALNWGTDTEFERFADWFNYLNYKHKIYVPGNHDFITQEDLQFCKRLLNASILIDKEIVIEGKRIYGSPYTPKYYDWAWMKPDGHLQAHWDNIPKELDLLITHGPPYGILDSNHRGDLCGSQTLMKSVFDKRPKVHAFGHIHESYGKYVLDTTTFINCAVARSNEPMVIEL